MTEAATTDASLHAAPSIWADFVDVFYAPGEVFERRRDGRFWPALLFVAAATTLLFYGVQTALGFVMEAEMQRALAAQGAEMTLEQMEQMSRMSSVFGVIGYAVAFPLGILLLGVVVWAVGKAMGAALTMATALVVASYSQFPRILQHATSLAQGLFLDTMGMDSQHDVALGVARFLEQASVDPVVLGLAARVELFTLWATALVAIGIWKLGRVSGTVAVLAAVLVWLVAALPTVAGTALAGGFGGG